MVAGALTSTGAETSSVLDAPGASDAMVSIDVGVLLTFAFTTTLSISTSPVFLTVMWKTVLLPRCTQTPSSLVVVTKRDGWTTCTEPVFAVADTEVFEQSSVPLADAAELRSLVGLTVLVNT